MAARPFSLVIVKFFDDFSQMDARASSESAQEAMESLVALLGWQLSVSDQKRKPFEPVFVFLGVEVNFFQL